MNNPIFIIGAPRSGTNILRDIITSSSDFITWDCDEINLLWLYDNFNRSSDRFTKKDLTPEKIKFINKHFSKIQKRNKNKLIVEKTCANSLRIDFIDGIFDNAKFIFIYRNGMDCISSTLIKRKRKFNLSYSIKKARYIPISLLLKYFFYSKILNKPESVSEWGIKTGIKTNNILDDSINIWKESIRHTLGDLNNINAGRVYKIKYENLVSSPIEEMQKMFSTMFKKKLPNTTKTYINKNIFSTSLNKSRTDLDSDKYKYIKTKIINELKLLNYE